MCSLPSLSALLPMLLLPEGATGEMTHSPARKQKGVAELQGSRLGKLKEGSGMQDQGGWCKERPERVETQGGCVRDNGSMLARNTDICVVFPTVGVFGPVFSGLEERQVDGWVSERLIHEEACQTPAINENDKGLTFSSGASLAWVW